MSHRWRGEQRKILGRCELRNMQPPYLQLVGRCGTRGYIGAYFPSKTYKRTVPSLIQGGLKMVDEEDAKYNNGMARLRISS